MAVTPDGERVISGSTDKTLKVWHLDSGRELLTLQGHSAGVTSVSVPHDGLRAVCVASRDNKPIGDKMIMNAAFLIQKAREAEFDAAVNKVAQKFGERLNFKYTGPWPPYNFVNIRLKLERGGQG